jgi:hypothetical protein
MRIVGGRNETAPGQGRGAEGSASREKLNCSKADTAAATSHAAKADLHHRAAAILARSLLSSQFTSPDVHTLEEALRALFEREAYYHERQVFKLQYGGDARDRLEAAFDSTPVESGSNT